MTIPKAPVLTADEAHLADDDRRLFRINKFIEVEWAKLFEGAEVVQVTKYDDAWCDVIGSSLKATHTQICLKPVPIKGPGVTRDEISDELSCGSHYDARTLLRRILDEGLANEEGS